MGHNAQPVDSVARLSGSRKKNMSSMPPLIKSRVRGTPRCTTQDGDRVLGISLASGCHDQLAKHTPSRRCIEIGNRASQAPTICPSRRAFYNVKEERGCALQLRPGVGSPCPPKQQRCKLYSHDAVHWRRDARAASSILTTASSASTLLGSSMSEKNASVVSSR